MDSVQTAAIRRAQDALRIAAAPSPRDDYSLLDALRALRDGRPQDAGRAWEIHQDLARGRTMHTSNSMMVPGRVFARDLSAGSASAGGYLVGTENAGVIELLRGRSVIVDAGATVLSGLAGNVTIPKETAAAAAYWLADESTAGTPGSQTFGQVALTPKNAVSLTKFSRQLLMQTGRAVERFVGSTLAKSIAAAVDTAALNGSGLSGQPTGLIGTPGVGSVTGTSLDTAKVLEFQTDVADGLSEQCAYVTTRAVAATLAGRAALASGTERTLWSGNLYRGELGGFPGMTSPNVPASHLVFGHWPDLVIGEWGDGIELAVDPNNGFTTGIIAVRAWLACDVAVLRPSAFSIATAVT